MIDVARTELLTRQVEQPAVFRGPGRPASRGVAILRLADAAGRVGQGEASPLPGYSSESFDQVLAELERFAAGPAPAVSCSAAGLPQAIEQLLAPQRMGSAARFACETALFDLAGARCGRPLSELLGPTEPLRRVSINWLLPPGADDLSLEAIVVRGLEQGVATFKAKIGRAESLDEELAPLVALRRRFGDTIALRLDANEAWTLERAPRELAKLVPLGTEFVEQPVARAALFDLAATPVPVAADETMQLDGALERLRERAVCRVVVLKPACVGGLLRARKLADSAAREGFRVVVTHLFDGPLGVAAAAELALSLAQPPAACGLAAHGGLGAWNAQPPQLRPSCVRPTGRAGLGLPLVDLA